MLSRLKYSAQLGSAIAVSTALFVGSLSLTASAVGVSPDTETPGSPPASRSLTAIEGDSQATESTPHVDDADRADNSQAEGTTSGGEAGGGTGQQVGPSNETTLEQDQTGGGQGDAAVENSNESDAVSSEAAQEVLVPEEESEAVLKPEDLSKDSQEVNDGGQSGGQSGEEIAVATLSMVARYTGSLPLTTGINRTAGSDRYTTAVEMSKRLFPVGQKPPAVFVASGSSYSDGLTLGAYAAYVGGPLLLVRPNAIPAAVANEIARLGAAKIYVAGGTGAVSNGVVAALKKLAPEVVRLGGSTRFETAALIAEQFPVGVGAMLATGNDFPDALVASAGSVRNGGGGPVLLTRGFNASDEVLGALKRLQPSALTIVGGTWSKANLSRIASVSGKQPELLTGTDRYGTSAAVAERFWQTPSTSVIYASGQDYPDALVSVPASVAYDSPVVLTRTACKPESIEKAGANQDQVLIVGGPLVLANSAISSVCGRLPEKVSVSGGYYRFNMTHRAQENGYYCGPATAQMILARLGYSVSPSGLPLTQHNLARSEYLMTDDYERTAWVASAMSRGLNNWMGSSAYVQKAKPSASAFRQAVRASFTKTGRPVVVDAQEYSGGRHYNGHPAWSTFSHLMPVEGYNDPADQIIMLDPASHFYKGSKTSFTHRLGLFADYLQDFGMYY